MANIKSINGNPIVLDGNGIADESITNEKLTAAAISKAKAYANGLTAITGWQSGVIYDATGSNIESAVQNPVANADWKHVDVSCQEGDKFVVTCNSGTSPAAWVFTDASYNVIGNRGMTPRIDYEMTAPRNAAHLVLNLFKTHFDYDSYKGGYVSNDVAALSDMVGKAFDDIGYVALEGWDDGYIKSNADVGTSIASEVSNPIANVQWQHVVVPCAEGDHFTITANGGSNPAAYAFTDSTYHVLKKSVNNQSGLRMTAPYGSAYLVLNRKIDAADECYKGQIVTESVGGLSSELHSEIDAYADRIGTRLIKGWRSGVVTIDANDNIAAGIASPASSVTAEYVVVGCTAGQRFLVSVLSISSSKCIIWADSNYDVIQIHNSTKNNYVIEAPVGAAYLVLHRASATAYPSFAGVPAYMDDRLLDIPMAGRTDMGWSWWYYPQVVSHDGIRDRLYFTYVTSDGYAGVASYDRESNLLTKTHLKRTLPADAHNGIAVKVLSDGTILCAWATGHQTDRQMHVRRSLVPESIEAFGDDIALAGDASTTYCQLVEGDGRLYMFYRAPVTQWCYRYSEDEGLTWSEEYVAITCPVQFYCRFIPTTTDGVFRIILCTHATTGDPAIRHGFFHADTRKMYDTDGVTELGTSVDYDEFTVLVPVPEGFEQMRMFDAAVTAPSDVRILYAPMVPGVECFHKLYANGTTINICNGGYLLSGLYPLGMNFLDPDTIASTRGSSAGGGTDYVELYHYDSVAGTVTLQETVHSELRGSGPTIRNEHPICDVNGNAFLWERGWFGETYTYYNTDPYIHFVDE